MKQVFTSMDALAVEQVRTVLENAGIECSVRNRDLRALAGSVPFAECWPELWVVDDARAGEAEALIRELTAAKPVPKHLWRCPQCGQPLEPQFTSCWRCEGRIAMAVEEGEQRRRRAAAPHLFFWMLYLSVAALVFYLLRAD